MAEFTLAELKAQGAQAAAGVPKELTLEELRSQGAAVPGQQGSGGLDDPRSIPGILVRHFGQGAGFGMTDELSGLAGAGDEAGRRLRSAVGFDKADYNVPLEDEKKPLLSALLDRYRHERDAQRVEMKKGEEAHPVLSAGTELAGALSVPMPGPGKAAAGETLLSRIPAFAKVGAGAGAAYGAGNSEADLTKGEFGQFFKDVAGDAAFGGVAGGLIGPAIEKGAGKLGDYLTNSAATKAFKALNGNAKITDKARGMGFDTPEEMMRLGRWAMDNKLIPLSGDAATIMERAEALKQKMGGVIGDMVKKADASGKKFSYADALAQVQKMLGNVSGIDEVANSAQGKQFLEAIAAQQSKTPGSFGGARNLKTRAQGMVDWKDEAANSRQVFRGAVGAFTDDFQRQMANALGPEEMAKLQAANGGYGNAADVSEFAHDAASRAQQGKYKNLIANALAALSTGGAGAAIRGPEGALGGLALFGAGKVLNNPGTMAHFDDALAKVLQGRGTEVATQSIPKLSALMAEYLRQGQAPGAD